MNPKELSQFPLGDKNDALLEIRRQEVSLATAAEQLHTAITLRI